MQSALACDLPPCREGWLNAGGERRTRLLAKRVCPASSRHRALHETPGQLLFDLQQDHDGQDDQGSHERFLRLAGGIRSNLHASPVASVIRCRIRKLRCGLLSRAWFDAPD